MWSLLLASLLCVTFVEEKLPVPDDLAIPRAEALLREVYGKRLDAAKTPQQKADLARELLEIAQKETDAANKYVALRTARSLAIQAGNGALAVGIVRAQVAAFAADSRVDKEQLLERAELLWNEAEHKRGQEQLAWRLDAIEAWLRSGEQSALLVKKWEDRIQRLDENCVIVLRAKEARIIGSGKMTYWPDLDAINPWTNPAYFVEWVSSLPAGKYEVEIEYAADPPMASQSLFEIGIFQSQRARVPINAVRFSLKPTGPWATFGREKVGILSIREDNNYVIRLRVLIKIPPQPLEQGLIAPRLIALRRVELSRTN